MPARETVAAPAPDHRTGERAETEERLIARYGGDEASASAVRGAVAEAYDRLADARVTAFLPVLVERSVRRRVTDGVTDRFTAAAGAPSVG